MVKIMVSFDCEGFIVRRDYSYRVNLLYTSGCNIADGGYMLEIVQNKPLLLLLNML